MYSPYARTLRLRKCLRNCTRKTSKRHTPEHSRKSRIGPLRKGELAKHGYHRVVHLTIRQRRNALRKAIHEFGSLGVWRKLNAVAVYTKHSAPKSSRVFKEDMDWIKTEFGIKGLKTYKK